jgi:hypothetical protein
MPLHLDRRDELIEINVQHPSRLVLSRHSPTLRALAAVRLLFGTCPEPALLYLRPTEGADRMGWRGRDVELRCGQCDAKFARVHIRAVYPTLHVRPLDNDACLMPRPGYSINEEARQRGERAAKSGDPLLIESESRVTRYLHNVAGEIVYDLRCPCGLRYVRSTPDLRWQIRNTGGPCVTLSPNIATWRK